MNEKKSFELNDEEVKFYTFVERHPKYGMDPRINLLLKTTPPEVIDAFIRAVREILSGSRSDDDIQVSLNNIATSSALNLEVINVVYEFLVDQRLNG